LTEFGKVGQSERIMILRIEALKQTVGTRLSLAGSISKLLQFNNQPNDEIVVYIKQLNELLQEDADKKQKEMSVDETLPTVKEIKKYMNTLYDKGDYLSYALLYLMVHTKHAIVI
jgi:hypothetical protein